MVARTIRVMFSRDGRAAFGAACLALLSFGCSGGAQDDDSPTLDVSDDGRMAGSLEVDGDIERAFAGEQFVARQGEAEPSVPLTAEQQRSVLAQLSNTGFDVSTAVFEGGGGLLRVEDDILFDGHSLLEQGSQLISKGWIVHPEVKISREIWLAADPAVMPSASWLWATIAAAGDWQQTGIQFYLGPSGPPEKTVTLRFEATGGSCTVASGRYPSPISSVSGTWKIGHTIKINPNYNCPQSPCGATNPEDIPFERKIKAMAHEFGHTLGLRHVGSGTHIPGTEESNYPTIMGSGCPGGNVSATLTSDDVASADTIFIP